MLANDDDPDGDSLAVTGVGQPANGTAAVNGDNTVTYTPTSGFHGTDSFTYSISDGKNGTASSTVRITVVNSDAPVACFKYSPKRPNQNTQVKFDGSCSSDDKTSDSQLGYEWDFQSDGTYDATGMKPRHRFGAAGTYKVTLRVTDGDGLSNTVEKSITVKQDDDDEDDDGPEYGGGGDSDDDDGGDD